MKKEDLRKDPIRDKILNFINSIGENKKRYTNIFLLVISILLFIIFYSNKQNSTMNNYNLDSSVSQNKYIDGITDIAVDNFEDILNNFSQSESYNQAYIYLLNNSLENEDYNTLEQLIDKNNFNTKDATLKSMVYNLYANYYLNVGDYDNAQQFYLDSINISYIPEHLYTFKLNLILLYLHQGQKNKAKEYLSQINIDNVVPYQLKNKYEQIIASVE